MGEMKEKTDLRLSIPPARMASRAFEPVDMLNTVERRLAASRPVMKALGRTLEAASLILSTLISERPYRAGDAEKTVS